MPDMGPHPPDAAAPVTPGRGRRPKPQADLPPMGEILAEYQERLARARAAAAEAAAAAAEPSSDTRTFAERMAAWEAEDNGQIPCYDCAVCERDRSQWCNDPAGYCHPGPCQPRTDDWGQPVA